MRLIVVTFLLTGILNATEFFELHPFDKDDLVKIEKKVGKVKTAEIIMQYQWPEDVNSIIELLGHEKFRIRKKAIEYFQSNKRFHKSLTEYLNTTEDPEIKLNIQSFINKYKAEEDLNDDCIDYLVKVRGDYKGRKSFKSKYLEKYLGGNSIDSFLENYINSSKELDEILQLDIHFHDEYEMEEHPSDPFNPFSETVKVPVIVKSYTEIFKKVKKPSFLVLDDDPFAEEDPFDDDPFAEEVPLAEVGQDAKSDNQVAKDPPVAADLFKDDSKESSLLEEEGLGDSSYVKVRLFYAKKHPKEFQLYKEKVNSSRLDLGIDSLIEAIAKDKLTKNKIFQIVTFLKTDKSLQKYSGELRARFLYSSNLNCRIIGMKLSDSIEEEYIINCLEEVSYHTDPLFMEYLLAYPFTKKYVNENAFNYLYSSYKPLSDLAYLTTYENRAKLHWDIDLCSEEDIQSLTKVLAQNYTEDKLIDQFVELKLDPESIEVHFEILYKALQEKGVKNNRRINEFLRSVPDPKADYSFQVIKAYIALGGSPQDIIKFLERMESTDGISTEQLKIILGSLNAKQKENFFKNIYSYDNAFLNELVQIPGALENSLERSFINWQNSARPFFDRNFKMGIAVLRERGSFIEFIKRENIQDCFVIKYWRFITGLDEQFKFDEKQLDLENEYQLFPYIVCLVKTKQIEKAINVLQKTMKVPVNSNSIDDTTEPESIGWEMRSILRSPIFSLFNESHRSILDKLPKYDPKLRNTLFWLALAINIDKENVYSHSFFTELLKDEKQYNIELAFGILTQLGIEPILDFGTTKRINQYLVIDSPKNIRIHLRRLYEQYNSNNDYIIHTAAFRHMDSEGVIKRSVKARLNQGKLTKNQIWDVLYTDIELSEEETDKILNNSECSYHSRLLVAATKGKATVTAWKLLNEFKDKLTETRFLFFASKLAPPEERVKYIKKYDEVVNSGDVANQYDHIEKISYLNELSEKELAFVDKFIQNCPVPYWVGEAVEIVVYHKGIDGLRGLIEKNINNPSALPVFLSLARKFPNLFQTHLKKLEENAFIYYAGFSELNALKKQGAQVEK